MAKNYYAILGILPTATLEEIRSAYRQRAKQYHPDRFGVDSAPFLNIQEAYDVLSDPANRASYDPGWRKPGASYIPHSRREPEIVRSRRPPMEPLRSNRGPLILETVSPLHSFRTFHPSFEEIFDSLRNVFDLETQRKNERFRNLTMEVVMTPDQASRGGRIQILMPIETMCSTCGGFGETGFWYCPECNGSGVIRAEFPLEVEYPPGIRDFCQIALPLDRFGVHDICPILPFRISPEGDFGDL
jgi:molecular chaperone DnaJ